MPSSSLYNATEQDGDLHADHEGMGRHTTPKDKPFIDVVLDTPFLTLKGTGPDVEPTRLSGNVVLYLTEATSIKEITLQFRGKARLPVPVNDSLINSTSSLTYIICHHDWSFLEGSNKHTRTLKAGRHFFPFHLEVGGSLPSSVSTHVLGGASIAYKLRAVAVRPFLAHNLQCMVTVPLIRSFTSESLEYQQTLEIENTWPGKIMYSVALPQKAWAMGDKLGTLVKLSPTAKGVVVESILTNLVEITKIFARSGKQEHTRVVASSRHDFIEGRPVLIESNKPWLVIGQASPMISRRGTPPVTAANTPPPSAPPTQPPSTAPSIINLPPLQLSPSTTRTEDSTAPLPTPPPNEDEPIISSDIVTVLFLPIPNKENEIVPSHSLEPIIINHRVRWSIYIRNPDAHVSELRCSLPVTILHKDLLQEVRAYTRGSRRTVLGPGLDNTPLDDGDDLLAGAGVEEEANPVEDRELPSYTAHVRDRVANMFLPEAATMRITNPWVINGTSPVSPTSASFMGSAHGHFALGEDRPAPPLVNTHDALNILAQAYNPELNGLPASASTSSIPVATIGSLPVNASSGPYTPPLHNSNSHPSSSVASPRNGRSTSHPSSGYNTPLEVASHVMAHLPHVPGSGQSTPLDWINCELMMSVSEDPRTRFQPPPEPTQAHSRGPSRGPSRASSPERRATSRSSSPVHGDGHHQKGFGGFFKGAMKGLSFTKHHGHSPHNLPWNSHSSQSPQPSSSFDQQGHDTRPAPLAPRPTASRQSSLVALSPDPATAHTFIPPQSSSRPVSRPSSPFTHTPRLSGTFSPSGSLPRSQSSSAFPISPISPLIPTTNDAMLHRAFTEVPDYSIASKGFIGGVPPLSSLQGLPSYEESARLGDRYKHLAAPPQRTATPDPVSASRTGGIGGAQAGPSHLPLPSASGLGEDRRVMSDGDLTRRFQGLGASMVDMQDGEMESEDAGDDEGIQMRSRGRTLVARKEATDDGMHDSVQAGRRGTITTWREDTSEDDGIQMGRRRTVTARQEDAD